MALASSTATDSPTPNCLIVGSPLRMKLPNTEIMMIAAAAITLALEATPERTACRGGLLLQLLQDLRHDRLAGRPAGRPGRDPVPARPAPAGAAVLLRHQRVAVAPGTAFGPAGGGWVRLSLAAETEDLREGARRLAGFTLT